MTLSTVLTQEANLLQKAFHAGQEMAQLGLDATHIKEKVSNAIEDGIKVAKRTVKSGRHRAQEVLDDATYRIKHDPLRSVAICFGVGMGLGAMVGWLAKRNGSH